MQSRIKFGINTFLFAIVILSLTYICSMETSNGQPAGENILSDPGLELDSGVWEKSNASGRSIVTTEAHSGLKSEQIISDTQWVREVYQSVSVTGGATYDMSAWVKTSGVDVGASIMIQWLDISENILSTDVVGTLTGSQDWTELSNSFTAPANAVFARFRLFLDIETDGAGTAWFDDHVLTEITELDLDGDGYTSTQGDCNDNDIAINPGAIEYCDGIDNNCDGQVDEQCIKLNLLNEPGFELGGEGWEKRSASGRSIVTTEFHSGLKSEQILSDDQWEREVYQHVSVTEGQIYEVSGWVKTIGVGVGASIMIQWLDISENVLSTEVVGTLIGTQDWTELSTSYVAPTSVVLARFRLFSDVDPDGEGTAWFDDLALYRLIDQDGDSYTPAQGDCNDNDAAINPGATEVCDGVDNNCDGQIDEGVKNTYYADTDGDGYGDLANTVLDCTPPSGYVADNTDCNDSDANERPGQTWYKDTDNDGYSDGTTDTSSCTRPGGYKTDTELTATSGDCDDSNATVNPGVTEVIGNGIDDDCDPNTPDSVVDLPDGTYGDQYEGLVPPDATITSYDDNRFAIITGSVQDSLLNPIPSIVVSIHGHSEYGTVQTDSNGVFSIPVEGGGTITVVYKKTGFITGHRNVDVPWNDIAVAETVTLIPEDTASTTLTFDGNPATIITHNSSTITDAFGSRSLTMVFTGDNQAFSVDVNGVETPLTTITTRATEFETPESMPAKLPPNSAYTYCSELSVDGANKVRFDKPVVVYVDNFLGFGVGGAVPVGYYDRDRAVWIPSDNGVVVKLLDTDTDGIVDALDADGDDLPDDLNNDGFFQRRSIRA